MRLIPRPGDLLAAARLPWPLPARASQSPLRHFIIIGSKELPVSCAAASPSGLLQRCRRRPRARDVPQHTV